MKKRSFYYLSKMINQQNKRKNHKNLAVLKSQVNHLNQKEIRLRDEVVAKINQEFQISVKLKNKSLKNLFLNYLKIKNGKNQKFNLWINQTKQKENLQKHSFIQVLLYIKWVFMNKHVGHFKKVVNLMQQIPNSNIIWGWLFLKMRNITSQQSISKFVLNSILNINLLTIIQLSFTICINTKMRQ